MSYAIVMMYYVIPGCELCLARVGVVVVLVSELCVLYLLDAVAV